MDLKLLDEMYWANRYANDETKWDIGYVSTPLKDYIDQITDKNLNILIPGAGNGYEAKYLANNNFTNVTVCDIASNPLQNLKSYENITCVHGNFFELYGQFDLILEQTFFCAILPVQRPDYVLKCHQLLKPFGKLVGVLFDRNFTEEGPPFGGNAIEYKELFQKYFDIRTLAKCYNSIIPRKDTEIFMNLIRKS